MRYLRHTHHPIPANEAKLYTRDAGSVCLFVSAWYTIDVFRGRGEERIADKLREKGLFQKTVYTGCIM